MSEPEAAATTAGGIAGLPIWAWLAAALSVVTMGGGLAMPYVLPANDAATQSGIGPRSGLVAEEQPMGSAPGASGFLPGGTIPGDGNDDDGDSTPADPEVDPDSGDQTITNAEDIWSPAIFRLGFSFFVGFAIAYAVRTFVKFSLIALGMFFLLLFGMQYAGFITVEWGMIQQRYEESQSWISAQFSSFKDFVTGELPSAGLFATGFVVGFRRKG